jgi:hypothetical protein
MAVAQLVYFSCGLKATEFVFLCFNVLWVLFGGRTLRKWVVWTPRRKWVPTALSVWMVTMYGFRGNEDFLAEVHRLSDTAKILIGEFHS